MTEMCVIKLRNITILYVWDFAEEKLDHQFPNVKSSQVKNNNHI